MYFDSYSYSFLLIQNLTKRVFIDRARSFSIIIKELELILSFWIQFQLLEVLKQALKSYMVGFYIPCDKQNQRHISYRFQGFRKSLAKVKKNY